MLNNCWTDLDKLMLEEIPIIDVRAPIEFKEGAIPGSINLPILNDDERAQVGTTYKQNGQDEAIKLGHQLVGGMVKEQRVNAWKAFVERHPRVVLACFRGGLRSRTAQAWLAESGIHIPLIEGGYKRTRNFLLEKIEHLPPQREWMVISGATGSGKSDLLRDLQNKKACLDIEFLAKHRGSAFGAYQEAQPSQIDFENLLAKDLILIDGHFTADQPLIVEDESRMIGSRSQPQAIFDKIRSSEVVWIDDPMDQRVQRIVKEYLSLPLRKTQTPEEVFAKMRSAVNAIQKKLGGQRHSEVVQLIQESQTEYIQKQQFQIAAIWIQKLLEYYYDPFYFRSLDRRQVKIKFRGNFGECHEFLKNV